jgi:hypothetical protein
VRLLTWKSGTQIWAELHERAFRRLGGAPAVIVYDYVARHMIEVGLNRFAVGADLSAFMSSHCLADSNVLMLPLPSRR